MNEERPSAAAPASQALTSGSAADSTSEGAKLTLQFLESLSQISATEWDAVVADNYPFLRHHFLAGLEASGSACEDTGWQACHAVLRRGDKIVALMPLYRKTHSYGEYVFDWSWADAFNQQGYPYYPKLISAIPFTPATGPRIAIAAGENSEGLTRYLVKAITAFTRSERLSSWHLLFPERAVSQVLLEEGMHQRVGVQFHWQNEAYDDFEQFLSTFNSRKRKGLRRERKRVAEQDLSLITLTGAEITEYHWQLFYHLYQSTYAKRSGHGGYLSREFFLETLAGMGDQVIMTVASLGQQAVAAALYLRDHSTLYGRYWGAIGEFDCLHFEACYYQGIEYCIANGIQNFDPGAQGEHKIQRGFKPVYTWSNHYISDPRLNAAVGQFTRDEAKYIQEYRQQAASLLPFKLSDPSH